MDKEINKYVAEKMKHFRIMRNLSQEDVGEFLETSAVNVSRYENGKREIDQDILFKLSQLFKISINKFFPEVDNAEFIGVDSDTVMINVLGYIKAGIPIEAQEDKIGTIAIPKIWTKGGKEFYALKISGDSMSPKYNDGEIVIFEKTSDVDKCNKHDCAVMVNCTECTFKKVSIDENGITLIPYNTDYDVKTFSADQVKELPVTIIGLAIEKRVTLTDIVYE